MDAILKKAVEAGHAGMLALARIHSRLCRRLAVSSDAFAKRTITAILGLPVLLMVAFLAANISISVPSLALLAASVAGVTMILLALTVLRIEPKFLTGLMFCTYGAGLTALAAIGGATTALALIIAALPLEVWFVTRNKSVSLVVGIAAAILITMAFAKGEAGQIGHTLTGASTVALYAASLIGRGFAYHIPKTELAIQPVEPKLPATAEDGVQFVLSATGAIQSIDAATASKFGLSPAMLTGRLLLDQVLVADRVQYLSMLADVRADIPTQPIDIRLRSLENGHTVFQAYRVNCHAVGEAIVVSGRSLAHEQKLQKQIHALEDELDAERLSKGKLLAAVSHELRTPLNSIIGFSDLLTHEICNGFTPEKQREYAGLIHKAGHYMLELVNAVLDNARLETGSYSITPLPFDFHEAVELCTNVMLTQAEKKNIAFCHRVNADIGDLVADRRAVQQILLNLSANAVKFTEDGGCVTIDAKRIIQGGRAMLEFSIADTGIGIAKHDLDRIGTPFVRVDNNYTRAQEGSGLGLSVVKGLIELHEGTMTLKSCPGEGTIVTVQLPVSGPARQVGDEVKQELGSVVGIHHPQGDMTDEWKKDEDQDQNSAQTRKTG